MSLYMGLQVQVYVCVMYMYICGVVYECVHMYASTEICVYGCRLCICIGMCPYCVCVHVCACMCKSIYVYMLSLIHI